jgi:hypothetical protein
VAADQAGLVAAKHASDLSRLRPQTPGSIGCYRDCPAGPAGNGYFQPGRATQARLVNTRPGRKKEAGNAIFAREAFPGQHTLAFHRWNHEGTGADFILKKRLPKVYRLNLD